MTAGMAWAALMRAASKTKLAEINQNRFLAYSILTVLLLALIFAISTSHKDLVSFSFCVSLLALLLVTRRLEKLVFYPKSRFKRLRFNVETFRHVLHALSSGAIIFGLLLSFLLAPEAARALDVMVELTIASFPFFLLVYCALAAFIVLLAKSPRLEHVKTIEKERLLGISFFIIFFVIMICSIIQQIE